MEEHKNQCQQIQCYEERVLEARQETLISLLAPREGADLRALMAAVHPDEEYGRRESGEWVAVKLFPDDTFVERLPGSALVGWRYRGPFDELGPGASVEHRVIPWEDVTMDQGTGIVHVRPDQANCVQHPQRIVVTRGARGNPDPMTVPREADDQFRAHETSPTEDAYS